MKKLIILLFLVIATKVQSQVTFEQNYQTPTNVYWWHIKLNSTTTKYIYFNGSTSQFKVFNQNHSVYKTISIPTQTGTFPSDWTIAQQLFFSETLFNTDNLFEYGIYNYNSAASMYSMNIYNENGTIVFQEDSIAGTGEVFDSPAGSKMVLSRYYSGTLIMQSIYGLAGTFYSAVKEQTLENGNISAYPNPSNNYFRIEYKLPTTIDEATMEIYDLNGKLVKSYLISNLHQNLLIESSELTAGTYTIKISKNNLLLSTKIIKL